MAYCQNEANDPDLSECSNRGAQEPVSLEPTILHKNCETASSPPSVNVDWLYLCVTACKFALKTLFRITTLTVGEGEVYRGKKKTCFLQRRQGAEAPEGRRSGGGNQSKRALQNWRTDTLPTSLSSIPQETSYSTILPYYDYEAQRPSFDRDGGLNR